MRSRTFQFTAVILTVVLSSGVLGARKESFADRSQDKSAQNPTITIDIANPDESQRPDEPYRLGPEVRVKVIAHNETDQRITVADINEYAQNRPQLFKDGKLVAYRPKIADLVRVKDDEPDNFHGFRTDFIKVQPYSSAVIEVLNLSDWYGRLVPGSYRLINRYRFTIGGPWSADSKALSFEVARER